MAATVKGALACTDPSSEIAMQRAKHGQAGLNWLFWGDGTLHSADTEKVIQRIERSLALYISSCTTATKALRAIRSQPENVCILFTD